MRGEGEAGGGYGNSRGRVREQHVDVCDMMYRHVILS